MQKSSFHFELLLVVALASFLGPVSFAQSGDHPCRSIAQECRVQGYSNGGGRSSGQGLVKDCLEKVVAGQTLAGLNVSFETVSSCKARWKNRSQAQDGLMVARGSRKLNQDGLSAPSRARQGSTGFTERGPASSSAASSGAVQ